MRIKDRAAVVAVVNLRIVADAEQVSYFQPAVLAQQFRQLRLDQPDGNFLFVHLQGGTVFRKTFIEPHRRRRKVAIDQQMRVFVKNRSPAVLLRKIQGNVLALFIGAGATAACIAQEKSGHFDWLASVKRRELSQLFTITKCDDLQRRCVDAELLEEDAKCRAHLFKTLRDFAGTLFAAVCGDEEMR